MKKRSLILALLFFVAGLTYAQRTVTGTVTDDKGESLVGASVLVKGTTTGAVTDLDGKYSLNVPKGATTLVVSFTGFEAQDVALGTSNVVDVKLSSGVLLNETVVVGIGATRQAKSLGYGAQQVSGQDLSGSNTTNVIDALTGKVAGVQINSSSGAVGASSKITLRGQTSLDGRNQALIVIDGLRISNDEFNTESSVAGVAQSNRAIDINPNDIESVTVLKGGAASAIYGVEGANGVILFTTKKGTKKKGLTVEYSVTSTMTQVNKLPGLNTTFAKGTLKGYRGAGSTTSTSFGPSLDTMYFDGVASDYDPNGNLVGKSNPLAKLGSPAISYDPYKVYQTGIGWNHNLAINGSNGDNTTYRFSFGNSNEEGVVPKSNFRRTTIGVAGGSDLFNNTLHIKTSLNFVNSDSRRIQQGSNLSGLMLGLLRTPPSFDNSRGVADPVNDPTAYTNSNGSQRTYRSGTGYDNPYWVINKNPYVDAVNRFYGNVNLSYDLLPNKALSINGKLGVDTYSDVRKQEFEINSRTAPAGRVIDDRYNSSTYDAYLNLTGTLSLTQDIGMNYTLGSNVYSSYLKNVTITGDALGSSGFPSLTNTATQQVALFNRNLQTVGFLGVLDFNYKSFFYLTFTGRQDYTSTLIVPKSFDASKIATFYPSVSSSFVFSELIKANDMLNFGKLRISYAQTGGGAPSPYQTYTKYGIASPADGWTDGIKFPYNGLIGFTLGDNSGNSSLRPSTTSDFEIGTELKLFKNILSIDASYYTRKSSDLILDVPTSPASGYETATLNAGVLSTKGVDFVLGINPFRAKTAGDFEWGVNFNFTTWKTTVDELASGVATQFLGGFTSAGIYNIKGEQYGQLYGGAWLRANSADGKSFNADLPYNKNGAILIDADGYPIQDPVSRKLGNPNPDFTLGINNTFSYKGVSLSFLFDIRQGGQMWNGTLGALNNFGASVQSTTNRYQDYVYPGIVQGTGAVNTKPIKLDQAWYQGLGSGFGPNAEQFIQNSGFARLRQVNVTYNFPSKFVSKLRLSNLSLSFTGRNLLLWTDYTGIDPETSLVGGRNAQGLDYFNQPGVKSYAFSLNVKF